MAFESLGDFLTVVEDAGELLRISATVDPVMEAAAISQRLFASGHAATPSSAASPVVVFSGLRNSQWPLVTNLWGTPWRLARACGVNDLPEMSVRYAPIAEDLWCAPRRMVPRVERFPARRVRQAGCQQIIKLGKDVNLWELPALRSWPGESSPALHQLTLVIPHPETGESTYFPVSLQFADRQRCLPYWTEGHPAWSVLQYYRQQRRQLPVAIMIGGDPSWALAGELANWLTRPFSIADIGRWREQGPTLVKCRSHDLEVAAEAEMILEGFIDVEAADEELPAMALPTGHYSAAYWVPVIQIAAITHRANPLCTSSIWGANRQEVHARRDFADQLLRPVIRQLCPEVHDFARPEWGHGQVVFVAVEKNRPFAAQAACQALWSTPGLRSIKWMMAVDEDVSVRDDAAVLAAYARHADPQRDTWQFRGPAHPEDHAAAADRSSGQFGVDATRKLPAEGSRRPWPVKLQFPEEVRQRLESRWLELGLSGPQGTFS